MALVSPQHRVQGARMAEHVINLDMDKKCAECGKGGSAECGLCLGCVGKAMNFKRPMKSQRGLAMQTLLLAKFGAGIKTNGG